MIIIIWVGLIPPGAANEVLTNYEVVIKLAKD
jgi:hypothetical protein